MWDLSSQGSWKKAVHLVLEVYMGHKSGLDLTCGGAGYFEKCLQNYFSPC